MNEQRMSDETLERIVGAFLELNTEIQKAGGKCQTLEKLLGTSAYDLARIMGMNNIHFVFTPPKDVEEN